MSAIERARRYWRLVFHGLGMASMIATTGCFRGGSTIVPPASMSAVDDRAVSNRTMADRAASPRASSDRAFEAIDSAAERADLDDEVTQAGRTPASFTSLPAGLQPNAKPREWEYIVLHHTATESGDVATIDEEHRQRKDALGNPWLGIGYHFVIGNGNGMADGVVEPTFRWRQQIHGAHAGEKKYNENGIGICLVGNFVDGHPTQRQIAATRDLVEMLRENFDIAPGNIVRHSDVTATDCPGANFPLEEIVARPVAPSAESAKRITVGGQSVREQFR